jgi:biopolymer transport protein ExbD
LSISSGGNLLYIPVEMETLFRVSLVVVTVLFPAFACNAQTLQKGVSVDLPQTSNAVKVPEADNQNALILTVTANGSAYFGVTPIVPDALAQGIKKDLANRTGAKLYVKADARTQYADVMNILSALRTAGVDAPTLLTAQADSPQAGTLAPPKGLEVLLDPTLPAGTVATVVQLLNSGQESPVLKINNDRISWSALQSTLTQHFQKGDERVILLKADAQLSFADIVQAVDMCRATGAKVVLGTP